MSTIRSKDRASLCTFTFADGRRCRTPRFAGHPHLCYFHALKESRANASVTIGNRILDRFSGSYLSACDLSSALGQVFAGVAQGSIKRKTAATLAYLGQTRGMLGSHRHNVLELVALKFRTCPLCAPQRFHVCISTGNRF